VNLPWTGQVKHRQVPIQVLTGHALERRSTTWLPAIGYQEGELVMKNALPSPLAFSARRLGHSSCLIAHRRIETPGSSQPTPPARSLQSQACAILQAMVFETGSIEGSSLDGFSRAVRAAGAEEQVCSWLGDDIRYPGICKSVQATHRQQPARLSPSLPALR
jgi:hypothetical protein